MRIAWANIIKLYRFFLIAKEKKILLTLREEIIILL